jgi:hypothetical protein
MNPRETQAGGSARDNLSAVEAHVKADSTTPACRLDRLCGPHVSPRGPVRKATEHQLCPHRRSCAPLKARTEGHGLRESKIRKCLKRLKKLSFLLAIVIYFGGTNKSALGRESPARKQDGGRPRGSSLCTP